MERGKVGAYLSGPRIDGCEALAQAITGGGGSGTAFLLADDFGLPGHSHMYAQDLRKVPRPAKFLVPSYRFLRQPYSSLHSESLDHPSHC